MPVKLKFVEQNYQNDCVDRIVNNTTNLVKKQTLINIKMETGTGKTFTYIKSIFELHKSNGYKKFLILVPSIAIREGIKKNFEITKDYFKTIYANEKDKEIDFNVYESGKISIINNFIRDDKLSALIITPSSFNKDSNILNKPLESDLFINTESSISYLDGLQKLNPIVIIDEPHKFEGEKTKKSLENFKNYVIRFGATFPLKDKDEDYCYVLDSISAFKQNLVKRIIVYQRDIISNGQNLIGIKNKRAIVDNFINGNKERQILNIGGTYNGKVIQKINKNNILVENELVEIDYNFNEENIRSMINLTIKLHFNKEQKLFEKGIKTLTLFFIKNINDYRNDGKIYRIFLEEYAKVKSSKILSGKYADYLKNDNECHKGYFSGDKGKTQEEKEKLAIDEILKDKEKLLSFESPVRFIFSVWALQEGWDNPNVFTICKLSNFGSEISKLQQIGRGLRICVNQNGERLTIDKFNTQEEFWDINSLEVVVSNFEGDFVKGIQNDILSNSNSLKNEFTEAEIRKEINKITNDSNRSKEIFCILKDKNIIKCIGINENEEDLYEKSNNFNLDELDKEIIEIINKIFENDEFIKECVKTNIKSKQKLKIKDKFYDEFCEIWRTIKKNAIYTIDNLDNDKYNNLIKCISDEIKELDIIGQKIETTKSIINNEDLSITRESKNSELYKENISLIDMMYELSSKTNTPIGFIKDILNAIDKDIIKKNTTQFKKEIIDIIKKSLVNEIEAIVFYNFIDEEIDLPREINAGNCGKYQESIPLDMNLKEQWLFENVIEYDSYFEKKIITDDKNQKEIKIFAKMPKLEINTPIGKYNPDFCYLIKTENEKKFIMIIETKGYKIQREIPNDEKLKIDFAKSYFNKLKEKYKDRINIVFRTRTKNHELSTLITEVINGQ